MGISGGTCQRLEKGRKHVSATFPKTQEATARRLCFSSDFFQSTPERGLPRETPAQSALLDERENADGTFVAFSLQKTSFHRIIELSLLESLQGSFQ